MSSRAMKRLEAQLKQKQQIPEECVEERDGGDDRADEIETVVNSEAAGAPSTKNLFSMVSMCTHMR